jgi:hypothetical protein
MNRAELYFSAYSSRISSTEIQIPGIEKKKKKKKKKLECSRVYAMLQANLM